MRSSQLRTLLKRIVDNRTWKKFRPVRDLNPWPLRYRRALHRYRRDCHTRLSLRHRRGLHRYRTGHGFKSRTGLNFFQVLLSTTRFSIVLSCEDLLISWLNMSLPQPTLKDTHDLIITRGDGNLVHDVIILPDLFSDHNVVTCKLDLPKPLASKTYVTYRSTKSLTADVLDDILPKVPYVRDPKSLVTVNLTILVIKYNTALEKICNDLAPMKSRWITHRPHAPWYNNDLCLNKRIKWRVEHMFRKTGLEVNKQIFAEACNKYQRQLEFHKSSYYKSKIERAGKNKLFRMSTNCFNLAAQPFLPIHLWTYWSKISTTSLSGRSNP